MTRRFFRARIAGVSLHNGFAEIPAELSLAVEESAIDDLFEQTGGYARFIEEIVLTSGRLAPITENVSRSNSWTRERVCELIERFLKEHLRFDQFCRLSLRDVERDPRDWAQLEALVNSPDGGVRISDLQPHPLETSGIARRKDGTTLIFASPMWARHLKSVLHQQHRADIYASLGEWERAWNLYTGLRAADCDRPLDGDERYRLNAVIDAWEDYLVEVTIHGTAEVARHFLLGAQHLYGCESGVLFDQNSHRVILEFGTHLRDNFRLFSEDATIPIMDESIDFLRNPARDTIQSSPRKEAGGTMDPQAIDLTLQLRRTGDRDFDNSALKRLRRSLRRFWLAYQNAERMEYAGLRERHLQVVATVNNLLSHFPGDMGRVVQGTVDALLEIGGYYRILICLVSPTGERIQAVAGRCIDSRFDFNYPTDLPLNRTAPSCDLDIQQWVAILGDAVAVDDASSAKQVSPRTNSVHVVAIGMKGIAVVPMKVIRTAGQSEEILGTIHFERKDKLRPTLVELRSFEILAGQIAVAFDHARRQTMLEQALNALKNEFRIVSPDRRIVFENSAAANADGRRGDRWVFPISPQSDSKVEERFDSDVIDDARRKKAGVHRYVTTSAVPHRGFEHFAAPITDWRTELKGVFQSEGMLGFVHQSFELSDFVRIHEASQQWLSLTSPRETAKRILDYFRAEQFRWCRIYLFETNDRLVSFEEYGISNPESSQRFRDGKFVIDRSENGQQAFFLMDHFRDLAVLQFDPKIIGTPTLDSEFGRGIPTYRTLDNWRPEFQKTDVRWLEAPLIVGNTNVGLIALEMPSTFSPQSYQMLRWCVMSVAVALHNALDAEREILNRVELAAVKEEAWKDASQLAIHQLANKLSPAEADCVYALNWLSMHRLEVIKGFSDTADALFNAQKLISFARKILIDFRRYASDEPFIDICEYRLNDLLSSVQNHLASVCPQLNTDCPTTVQDIRVLCSRDAIMEVIEILALNSITHSRRDLGELRFTISVDEHRVSSGATAADEPEVCLVFRDNGYGIDSRDRPRIFDAFFTTSQAGNGLGLAIAQRFMLRQGGSIIEQGTDGNGACFCLFLPRVRDTQQRSDDERQEKGIDN
ncbi:MAG: ATP-binding protein [Planctomycetota bacterium]